MRNAKLAGLAGLISLTSVTPAAAQEAQLLGVWRCELNIEQMHIAGRTTFHPDGTGITQSKTIATMTDPEAAGPIPFVMEGTYNFGWKVDGTSLLISEKDRTVTSLTINDISVDPNVFPWKQSRKINRLTLKTLSIDRLVLGWGTNGDETCMRD